METQQYKALVTPGRQVTSFSRDEVAVAMFVARYSRTPTIDESRRLCIHVDEGHSIDGKWELRLSFEDVVADVS